MVLRIEVSQAKPDMILALPVRNPQATDRQLLSPGYRLASETIARLRQLGVRELWVRYPGLEEIARYIDPDVIERRAKLAESLRRQFEKIQRQTTARIPYQQYVHEMASLFEQLLKNRTAAIFLDEASTDDPSLLAHSSTVCYLALLMGLRLDHYVIRQRKRLPPRYARKIGNLGLGAMLHDVGFLRLSPEIQARYRDTRNDADPAWRAHVRLGYELVQGQIEPSAAVVVLDHHQHYDGSGFPSRRGADGLPAASSGERIHIFARITTVADTFADLRHPHGGRRVATVQAIARMLQPPYIDWFDPHVLAAFLQVVPPYPPGSPVRLSDGRWAVPLEHEPSEPCRPKVQIIGDPNDWSGGAQENPQTPAEVLDLIDRPDLCIAFAENRDVRADNFQLSDYPAADRAVAEFAMIH